MLFLRYYDWDSHKESEPDALPPSRIKIIVASYAAILLPLSLLFLWHNDDAWTKPAMSWGLLVYDGILGCAAILWIALQIWADIAQFRHQVRLLRSLKSRRSLSTSSVALLSLTLCALAVLQIFRSRPNFDLRLQPNIVFVSLVLNIYRQLSLHIGYVVAGIGYLILFIVCVYYDWHDALQRKFGRIRLE